MCRFDHSPCDPTIHLKGSPSELFACVACGQHFQTKEAWRKHLESKVYAHKTPALWMFYQLVFESHSSMLMYRSNLIPDYSVLNHRCHLLPMLTASLRPIRGLCVLPVLPATSSSTSEMSVFSICQPKTTSQRLSPCMVRFNELFYFLYFFNNASYFQKISKVMDSKKWIYNELVAILVLFHLVFCSCLFSLSCLRTQRKSTASSCPTIC